MTVAAAKAVPPATVSVLLIDDDIDEFRLVDRLLTRAQDTSYDVQWVGTSEEGERRLIEQAHDVYLLDHYLGTEQGLELLQRVRARGFDRPVIILTGSRDPAIERMAIAAGASDYLPKGHYERDSLDRTIRYALERWRIQQELVLAERLFRSAFDGAPVGMALLRADGAIIDANRALVTLTGLDLSSLRRTTLHSFVDMSQSPDAAVILADPVYAAGVGPISVHLIGAGGYPVTTQVGISVLAGSNAALVAQVVDVTPLQAANERLETLVAEKDEFLASVSHELRTPLTAVLGFADMLMRGETSEVSDDELARTIYEHAADLTNIVEDLLVAARAEFTNIRVRAEPVRILEQVNHALETIPSLYPVAVSGSEVVALADEGRVRQVLRNLLTNAARYGGPTVRVNVGVEHEHVVVDVVDDGAGIDEGDWDRIFERYETVHHRTGMTKSLGLGLAISRQLARLMRGDLTYRRTEAGESCFELRLPLIRD
jgi:signal transduction histidine kinase